MELVSEKMPIHSMFGISMNMVKWVEKHLEMQGSGCEELIDTTIAKCLSCSALKLVDTRGLPLDMCVICFNICSQHDEMEQMANEVDQYSIVSTISAMLSRALTCIHYLAAKNPIPPATLASRIYQPSILTEY